MKKEFSRLKNFYMLWLTQSLSQFGSSITSLALTLWLYDETGSSLSTAMLSIVSYVPYVLMSVIAGALTDRFDKKKTMLVCDSLAALSTVVVFILYRTDSLQISHLYIINAVNGLMNTVQQPASEVAMNLIIPDEYYQKTRGLKSLSRSAVSILAPLAAGAVYGFAGVDLAIIIDLVTFAIAFIVLLLFIRIPEIETEKSESVITLAREGIVFLKETPLILTMIVFMSGINLNASAFDAALPGFIIPHKNGGSEIYSFVVSCSGIAMIIGSLLVSILPKPKNRVRTVYISMLISMSFENFLISVCNKPLLWGICQFIGWVWVPIMSANYEVIIKNAVPAQLQGRVYACRNTLQYFTIPIGLFLGGYMVDNIFEPFMAEQSSGSLLTVLFGSGKGSGAALTLFILGITGTVHCLIVGKKLEKYHYSEND